MTIPEMANRLRTKLQSPGTRSQSTSARRANIAWIASLDRNGLRVGEAERLIIIKETLQGEKLFIQYPGKESQNPDPERIKPWDFRPKVLLPTSHTFGDDLSFGNIWDALEQMRPASTGQDKSHFRALAVLFYRMAFMLDHRRVGGNSVCLRTTTVSNGVAALDKLANAGYSALYTYDPDIEVVSALSGVLGPCRGLSLEAFLHFNELLAWNEDCKYFYKNCQTRGDDWIRSTGRVNTLLSHVSVIGHHLGDVSLSDLLGGFSRGHGVGPATREKALRICDGLLHRD